MVCRTDKKPSGTREHVRSTPWAMRVSILWGHGSNSCVRFMGYSLRPFGSAFGSEKSSGRKQQLMQTKRPETLRFRVFLARREGFEPPAFWSVGCLQEKTEPFWLRFALFAAVYWMAFPLFPFSSAHSNSNLGQKWVKISPQAVFRTEMSYLTRRECQWNHKRGRNFANFPHSST